MASIQRLPNGRKRLSFFDQSGKRRYIRLGKMDMKQAIQVKVKVEDIIAARDHLKETGAKVLGDGEPRIGAHGKPILFLHPKDFCGTLVEIEQL